MPARGVVPQGDSGNEGNGEDIEPRRQRQGTEACAGTGRVGKWRWSWCGSFGSGRCIRPRWITTFVL